VGKIINCVTNRWFLQVLGILCIALLIWFVGPLIAIADSYLLASDFSRLVAIIVVVALWGLNIWRIQWQAKKRDQQLLSDLEGEQAQPDPTLQASEEEQDAIAHKFEEAIQVLKQSNVGKRKRGGQYLYELPWYIIIGPPGSGKTTALVNSGLNFPLAEKLGSEVVQGIGGTRHCDWWFTDEAVLIDTAGRFTTQDSHESVDKAAWQQFMDLLKRNRPQQPINGALITMSLSDLMQQNEDQRQAHARTIRRRIDELQSSLGIQFPVYFTFTKCDLIPGFSEYFAALDKGAREQVWGETFGLDRKGNSTFEVAEYSTHFDELVERLQQQLIRRLHDERDPEKRNLVVGFPAQFSSLSGIVCGFLQEVFADNRYSDGALLRGVYYTSGTQAGTPIDRLLGSLATSFGFSANTLVGTSGKGKSYFIHNLLRDVVFREKGVAGLDMGVIRRRRLLQRLSYAAAVLTIALGGAGWGYAYYNNDQRISEVQGLVAGLDMQRAENKITGADFEIILPELNTLRQATQAYAEVGIDHHLGLYQGNKVESGTEATYRKRLETLLLPMLVTRIEELMIDADSQSTDTLYELLRVYLMYAGVKPYDAELLSALANMDWQQSYALKPEVTEALNQHMQVLMTAGFTPRDFNENIVAQARKTLSRDSLEKQVYLAVKRELMQEHKYDLGMQDVLGPYGTDIFTSASQKDYETYVIPGMFTKNGFYKLFLTNSVTLGQQYLENNWVMGPKYAPARQIDASRLQSRVLNLYYEDYIRQWDGLLKDLQAKPAPSNEDSIRQVNLAAGLDSPLRYLVETLSRETTLTKFAGDGQGEGAEELAKSVASLNSKVQLQQQRVSKLLRNAKKAGLQNDLGQRVERHFASYHKLLANRGGSNMMERLLTDLGALGLYLDDMSQAAYSGGALDAAQARIAGGGRDPIAQLNTYKHLLPGQLQGMVDQMGTSNWQMMLDSTKQELDQLWQDNVVAECKSLIAGRYPLVSRARSEATLQDFSEFFAPEGVLDRFFTDYLKEFVDTRGRVWKERAVDGQQLGLSPKTLAQLQRAERIRDIFFEDGLLALPFTMRAISLDAEVSRFQLNLGEQEVVYRHGPRRTSSLVWPAEGDESVRILFENQDGSQAARSEEGPWAFFRLLGNSRLEKTRNKAVYRVTFQEGGRNVVYELRAKSVINPFGDDLLAGFRCPESL